MASNSESSVEVWVDERLAALEADVRWQPDAALSRLRSRLAEKSRWKGPAGWSMVTLAAAVLVLFLLVSPEPRVFAQRCVDCSLAVWESLNGKAAASHTQITPEQNRKQAIDFKLDDAAGQAIRLSSYQGQVVLLNFWATWCGGCKTEMPWFVELQTKYRDAGLKVVGVSLDDDGYRSVTPYLKEHGVNYPIVVGPQELGKQYGVEAMPVTLLIDRIGRIAVKHVGLVTKAQYQAEIEALLGETH
jgi:peroxiredoxin